MATKRKRTIGRVLNAVYGTPWAITAEKLAEIQELLELRARGVLFSREEIRMRLGADRAEQPALLERRTVSAAPGQERRTSIAVLNLFGTMSQRMNMLEEYSGGTSTEQFGRVFDELLADEKVGAILLQVDSPGGSVAGVPELAERIYKARGRKPIWCLANSMMASAAYYVGSAADQLIAAPSSMLGSIGTFVLHREQSKLNDDLGVKYTFIRSSDQKAEVNAIEPLSSAARKHLQEIVDSTNAKFVAAVAKHRGITEADVNERYGGGRTYLADEAVRRGMADRIATFEQVVGELLEQVAAKSQATAGGTAAAATDQPPPITHHTGATAVEENTTQTTSTTTQADAAPAGNAAQQASQPTAQQLEQAAGTERARIQDLRARGKILGVGEEQIEAAIDGGLKIEAALMQWTSTAAQKQTPLSTGIDIVPTGSSVDSFAKAALEALSARAGAGDGKPLSPAAAELRHKPLLQLAEISLRMSGTRVVGDADDIARAALRGDGGEIVIRGADGTGYARPSDFPNLMSNLAGKQLDRIHGSAPTSYQHWAAQVDSPADFKPKTLVKIGQFGELPHHPDGEPFDDSTFGEEPSWIATDSYGDEFKQTPRMVVDDDLGAILQAIADKYLAHELTLNRLCINLLVGNVAYSDGVALFHADHGNLLSPGLAPAQGQLSAMRKLLRKATSISGSRKLGLPLFGILVPEDLETDAEQLLDPMRQTAPVTDATNNTWRGKVTWWVDTMLGEASAAVYYGFANPAHARAIVYAHQRGFEKMKLRSYFNPATNSRHYQAEGRFAAAVNDFRPVVRNAGAGG